MHIRDDNRDLRQAISRGALWVASLACGISSMTCADPQPAERVEWNKVPVEVTLKIGVERQIQFPAPVKVGLPASLKTKVRAQSVSDTLYLQAMSAFDPTRIVVQTREGEHTYLLDVEASDADVSTPPIEIVDRALSEEGPAQLDASAAIVRSTSDPVMLTRFAAQQLYAPARLLKPAPGIVRVPVPTAAFPLVRGGTIVAHPLIGWRSGQRYVTAVKLTNASTTPLVLDPRSLRGEWLTAAFQHNRLLPAGSEADTTVAYLVSVRPFAASR